MYVRAAHSTIVGALPWSFVVDEFGLVEPVEALGRGVVVGVAAAADGAVDACFGEPVLRQQIESAGHLDNRSKRSDNPTRRHTSIGNLSPIDYETRHRHSQRHNHHNHPVQEIGSGSDCRRDGVHYSVGRKMLLDEFRLRVGGVPSCRPRRQYQKQARDREPAKRAALARFEDDERARVALDGFPGRLDRHAAGHDLHDRSLANLVVAHRLATLEIKDDGPTLRRAEEHARHPSIAAGHARSIRSRLTRAALLRRGRKRHKIPAFHRP